MNHYLHKSLLLFFSLLFIISSCTLNEVSCREAEGDIISEERQEGVFEALEVRGNLRVNLFQDTSIKAQRVVVVAEENLIDIVETRISGNVLVVDTKECYNSEEPITINIETDAVLSQVTLLGSGEIILQDTVRSDDLEFVVEGSGSIRNRIDFPILGRNCTARVKGSGNINLRMAMDSTNSQVNGSVDGSGNITLIGNALRNRFSVNGSGQIRAFDMTFFISIAEVIGSGLIEMTVTDNQNDPSEATVKGRVNGSGSINVRGNAALNIETSD